MKGKGEASPRGSGWGVGGGYGLIKSGIMWPGLFLSDFGRIPSPPPPLYGPDQFQIAYS